MARNHRRRRRSHSPERPVKWPPTLLASSFDPQSIHSQANSPLFTRLPSEIRELVYRFCFSADQLPLENAHPEACFSFLKTWPTYPVVYTSLPPNIPRHLRRSLHALRGLIALGEWLPDYGGEGLPDYLAAWQFAQLNSLVVAIRPSRLEDNLARFADITMAAERHEGLYVAAREGDGYQEWQAHMPPPRPSFHPTKKYLTRTPPITPLRIHINRDGWAQWGEYDLALALDPNMGDAFVSGTDMLAAEMLAAADARRARIALGLPPAPYPELSWGRPIATLFPDLTRLTLQLETFAWRVAELDHGEGDEITRVLAWDDEVEAYSWAEERVPGADSTWAWGNQPRGFSLITKGVAVPENIQQAIRVPGPQLEKLLQGSNVVVDNAVWEAKGEPGPFMEDDVTSGIYPYNAYRHCPFTHLAEVDSKLFATRLQRLMIPTIVRTGLDARQIVEERDRFIDARMQQRTREFEALLSTIGHGGFETSFDPQDTAGPPSPSLHLLDKYRPLRAQVAETFTHGSLPPSNRPDLRRFRKPTLRDARVTEQLERKQRLDRERRARSKHVEPLAAIRDHARQVASAHRAARGCVVRLGRLVLDFHQVAETAEQKRVERIAKERIRALKVDDEEAYRALVDNVKDTRITHLLGQTDAYLDSLAHAVAAQQNEGGRMDMRFEMEQGAATDATFGAQISAEDAKETSSGKTDYYAVAHCISEKITRQPSLLVGGTLNEYQLKGLQWMVSLYNNRLNGILADEMGLGKTIQTISLITFLIESKKLNGPYLVIVPLSTMANWSGEFVKWAPSLKVVAYKGHPAQRRALEGELRVGHFHVLLTTYEYIIMDSPILCKIKWLHMIIDEGHRMKNPQTKLTVTLTTYYHSRYRLLLSGTPLQNNLTELWSLLNFVLPRIFNSAKSFDGWFNTPFANSGTGDKIALSEEEALLIIRRLHKVLRPFLLRRLKKDVVSELPDKVEKVARVPMSALQSQMYKQMKPRKMIADGDQRLGVKGLSSELLQLRKICQHPFLFESVEDEMNPDGLVDDKLIRNSGKIELLNRILPKFFAGGHRVLIFFQITKVMDIMADFLTMMGWKFLRLDGVTKTEERANFVQLFNAEDSEYKVFILSTRAGGLGLNLQAADTVIMFDVTWNPHADLQAQDLVHRIGQTKTVLILHFITEKSVEEALHQYKLDIDHKVIEAGRFDDKSTPEEQENFLRSILEEEEDQDSEEASDMNDDELNSIIARNEAEAEMFRDMDTKREREALENWRARGHRGKPPPPITQFEELPECYQKDTPFEVALGSYQSALIPMDEDDRPPPPPSRRRSSTRRQVISNEE
ncbi:SNF2 family N-terminal domain-containing protein [Mycena olivaceomarginata]|nr:SNF2 family N-terminal domain-containing protein [Mycena olivaceomarginata]